MADDFRFWVEPGTSIFSDSNNWSLTSGGPGGAPVPGNLQIAVFDRSGSGACLLDQDINVNGIRMDAQYRGTLHQQDQTMTIGPGGMLFDGGSFEGGSAPISSQGDVTVSNQFKNTSDTMFVDGANFEFGRDEPAFIDNIIAEEIVLSQIDIDNKYVLLSDTPAPSRIAVNVVKGTSQIYGLDFVVSGYEVNWDGLRLDGQLAAGDRLRILYIISLESGYSHNNGLVKIRSNNNTLLGRGIRFFDLEFTDSSRMLIDTSSFVENELFLTGPGGILAGDSTIYVLGDVSCAPGYGELTPQHKVAIEMQGFDPQSLFVGSGSVLPNFRVDKTSSRHIVAEGQGPIRINRDFLIQDGTFNSGGLDIVVGAV